MEFFHRALAPFVIWALALAACGGGSLTVSEYSTEVATLLQTVDGRLDAHAEALSSSPPSLEGTRVYLADRVAGYHELVTGLDALVPPKQMADLHRTLREILGKLLVAEEARATAAATVGSVNELDHVWEGPEAQAIQAVEREAIVLCHAAQQRIDETEQRQTIADMPWIPAEMKEVVQVAFGCPL